VERRVAENKRRGLSELGRGRGEEREEENRMNRGKEGCRE
jgi:hypothetical protein